MNYKEIKELYSRATLKRLSRIPKKFYKLNLTLLTFEMLRGIRFESVYFLINECRNILLFPMEYTDQNEFLSFKSACLTKINDLIPDGKEQEDFINEVIQLTRKIFEQSSQNKKVLLRVSELEQTFKVGNYFRKVFRNVEDNNLRPHVWVDIDLSRGITPTYPDLLTYGDLINLWGMYLDKIKQEKDYSNKFNEPYNRIHKQLNYDLLTLRKYLNISAITFVEAYLYHVFYDVKKSNYSLETESVRRFMENMKVEDEQVIKQLIIPEFCHDNEENTKEISRLFEEYDDLNKKRNRFIHASAFDQNGESHLLPLLNIGHEEIIQALNICTDLVRAVENILPSELKILFWWGTITHPDYTNEEKGNFIIRKGV
ncbi:hypothetical protein [Sporosarcina sp. OR05]|uniref:hypothetical protein n=1 Tax=Sporosarcina sp. OR05 TaxID=2969819 RepID=UPI00352B4E80